MSFVKTSCLVSLLLVSGAFALPKFNQLVTFGDSYTDVVNVGDGGVAWPVYATGYANATLFPFARSGATCSNNITFRPFPSLFESQLPAYDARIEDIGSLPAEDTLYTLWIGTNDVGGNALLSNPGNSSIVDVTTCMVNWVSTMYEKGARNFLFQNVSAIIGHLLCTMLTLSLQMVPLQHVPMYTPDAYYSRFWTAPRNSTEWSLFITELVLSGNALTKLMLKDLAPTLPDAHVGKSLASVSCGQSHEKISRNLRLS